MTRIRIHPSTTPSLPALQQSVRGGAGLRAFGVGVGHHPGWAQAALVWLLLALVLVPTLGRLHQVIHANTLPGARTVQTVATAQAARDAQVVALLQRNALLPQPAIADVAPEAQPGHAHSGDPIHSSLLDRLVDHHTPVDCLLLDQLALGDALHSAIVALATPVPAQALLAHRPASAAARHVALFQARGPPAVG